MIPQHLVARAARAHAYHRTEQALEVGFYAPVSAKQTPLPEVAIEAMERALSAVAAEIWDQGYVSGIGSEYSGGHFPNPYRASEGA